MNNDMVKPIPATAATATTCPLVTPLRQRPNPQAQRQPGGAADTNQLADHQAQDHAGDDRDPTGAASAARLSGTPAFARANSGTTAKLEDPRCS